MRGTIFKNTVLTGTRYVFFNIFSNHSWDIIFQIYACRLSLITYKSFFALSGNSFEGADVENADFTEAALGNFDLKNLCKNPTLKGENAITGADTKMSVGCGPS